MRVRRVRRVRRGGGYGPALSYGGVVSTDEGGAKGGGDVPTRYSRESEDVIVEEDGDGYPREDLDCPS